MKTAKRHSEINWPLKSPQFKIKIGKQNNHPLNLNTNWVIYEFLGLCKAKAHTHLHKRLAKNHDWKKRSFEDHIGIEKWKGFIQDYFSNLNVAFSSNSKKSISYNILSSFAVQTLSWTDVPCQHCEWNVHSVD